MESAVSKLRTSGTPVSVIGIEEFRQISGRILVMVYLHPLSGVNHWFLICWRRVWGRKRHEGTVDAWSIRLEYASLLAALEVRQHIT